ncbi:hypothetical protein CJP74_05615 [Psittacicella melopsittaci]|uniref:ChbG/HpnK family deacetylase n=1 Tax=Psittacicella melopsittaci TaxID=2028576 RepID=A0A3A1Y3Q6_9GAMM|nr:ChbG/HpnK family deacetylase [Psittacicella melopsittaci]RIY32081.1 hypothetical protein CJP74_05615 [Psittacicella melopsittaci]
MDTSFKQLLASHNLEICVGDFGLTPGINQATINLAKAGKINCASVLVDAPNLTLDYIEEALRLKHDHKLSLGLHLNFTEKLSSHQNQELISPIHKLLNPVYLRVFFAKGNSKKIIAQIYKEIERQFFLFEDLFDCWPDFIDGHQHVHMLPLFAQALREFYAEHRLDQNKIWVRSLNRVNQLNRTNLPGASKVQNLILRMATKKARSSAYSMRKELLGVYNYDTSPEEFSQLMHFWLKNARSYHQKTGRGAVIMVHPSVSLDQVPLDDQKQATPYEDNKEKARLIEYQVLENL